MAQTCQGLENNLDKKCLEINILVKQLDEKCVENESLKGVLQQLRTDKQDAVEEISQIHRFIQDRDEEITGLNEVIQQKDEELHELSGVKKTLDENRRIADDYIISKSREVSATESREKAIHQDFLTLQADYDSLERQNTKLKAQEFDKVDVL